MRDEPEVRKRSFKRRLKKKIRWIFLRLAFLILPRLYLLYMWFVYKTSKVEELGFTPDDMRRAHGGGIYCLWHDEVFFVAYSLGKWKGHTLASKGDLGELITRFLHMCGYVVFRGGSSTARRRRELGVLELMIECMNTEKDVVFGITCDGSKGPIYKMKSGSARLSVACQVPMGLQRTWCKRYIRINTWDRTVIPLPFNHIVSHYQGPFYPPKQDASAREVAEFTAGLETALHRLSGNLRLYVEGKKNQSTYAALFPETAREVVEQPGEIILDLPIRKLWHGGASAVVATS